MAICKRVGCCVELIDGLCPRCNPGRFVAPPQTLYPAPPAELGGVPVAPNDPVAAEVALAKIADHEERLTELEGDFDLLFSFTKKLADKLGVKMDGGPELEGAAPKPAELEGAAPVVESGT